MQLLPEGQAGVAWEPANKALFLVMSGSIGHKSALTLFISVLFLRASKA
jgi:hypothetical protein